MKIGIFGGTFDPPHKGHKTAVRAARDALDLDQVYVIPTGQPPHKTAAEDTPGAKARAHMVSLQFTNEPRVDVLDVELQREGKSYTIDTVRYLRERHPDAMLYLIMGTDMFLGLEQWREVDLLMQMVTPVVFARTIGDHAAILAQLEHMRKTYGIESRFIEHAIVDISSSQVRKALKNRQGADLVNDAVYVEIVRNGYYGAKLDIAWLREHVCAMQPERAAHIRSTEEEAARLAIRWGADVNLAREAALLHDVTKGEDQESHLIMCRKYDMIPYSGVGESEKLLHAQTGAGLARAEFGVCDAVCDAIECHTTGKANMALLDKILYLADKIEPTRKGEAIQEVRKLAYVDLDETLLSCLRLSLAKFDAKGITPHPRTRETITWYVEKKK